MSVAIKFDDFWDLNKEGYRTIKPTIRLYNKNKMPSGVNSKGNAWSSNGKSVYSYSNTNGSAYVRSGTVGAYQPKAGGSSSVKFYK